MTSAQMVETLYLQPLPWEYSQALDLGTTTLHAGPQPDLAVLSSTLYAVELLKRCHAALDLAGTGSFDAAGFARLAQPWSWGPLQAVHLDQLAGPYAALLWAEPEAACALPVARRLREVAAPGATLHVIASAPLRRLLPIWRGQPPPAEQPLTPRAVRRVLERAEWQVESHTALHGPHAFLWSRLSQLAQACRRPDWSDRCLFAMRSRYREAGWLWPLAPVSLVRARVS
ncbi:MAG: hypothetical protein FJ026_09935 [Chloroflexi bacterium]|nr:hypothetical protein [Chloroflexota bacterium]